MKFACIVITIFSVFSCFSGIDQTKIIVDVLVIGGGTSGTAAGIAAAKLGAKTLIVESGPWLGGMISAAGVTCTDGNHHMPSGLWNTFREAIYQVYGGPKAVATGWVSHTQFEPRISDSIWKSMANTQTHLTIKYGWHFEKALTKNNKVVGAEFIKDNGEKMTVEASISLDATELGDVMASAGVPYHLGMELGTLVQEDVGVLASNNIVQDLTWVATLKDYGKDADCTIAKPAGYNPMEFDGVCTEFYHDKSKKAPNVDARKMLDYGRLPNNKFMINWPNAGNDTYLNVVNLSRTERDKELEAAKQTTLRFVYFIQTELGFKNLGLADDEFPTADRLALMPYHREGRRLEGIVRLNIKSIANPFGFGTPLYRTGISVGDYPIDHHHKKNKAAPQHLEFYPIPSYNIPLGALIPKQMDGLIVAEKGISVTNVVNGTTRLQPVVILTGQAAGTLAALSVQQHKQPRNIPVRKVQEALLQQNAYIMPYFDVKPNDPHFDIIQRIGATGLLKGKGEPYLWANRTWFFPDSSIQANVFVKEVNDLIGAKLDYGNSNLTIEAAVYLVQRIFSTHKEAPWYAKQSNTQQIMLDVKANWASWGFTDFDLKRPISRRELAALLHYTTNPFQIFPVDHNGNFIQ